MFGKNREEVQVLQSQMEALRRENETLKKNFEQQLELLRRQTAALASGLPLSPESIRSGLPYSEVPKEGVIGFIRSIPNLLILDLRSDAGWENGYIPGAKHIPATQILGRLEELHDRTRPILTVCANGNTGVQVCQTLAREGFLHLFNALGGMAGYTGDLVRPDAKTLDPSEVKGSDRSLVLRVIQVIEQDVRPGLKRDGGDIQVLEVEAGVVKVKMVGACVGCGSQKRTVEEGIKSHLKKLVPQIESVEDLSLGLAQ